MHRSAIDTDHIEVGGDGGRAVGWSFQQAVAQIEMPRQDARRDRQRVDAGIEHTETAGLPYPLLTRMPAADILFPADIAAADMAFGEPVARRSEHGGAARMPRGQSRRPGDGGEPG